MALILNGTCQSNNCPHNADYRITYDCGEGEPVQVIQVCKNHYEDYDEMPSGKKFYYFKEFAKKVEIIGGMVQ